MALGLPLSQISQAESLHTQDTETSTVLIETRNDSKCSNISPTLDPAQSAPLAAETAAGVRWHVDTGPGSILVM